MTRRFEGRRHRAQRMWGLAVLAAFAVAGEAHGAGWVHRLSGSASGLDLAAQIVGRDTTALYVVGVVADSTNGDDCVLRKLDLDGNLVWDRRYDGPAHADDAGRALALDVAGNVFVLAQSQGDTTGLDFVVLKYTPNGTLSWVDRFDGPGGARDEPYDIGVDSNGDAYVCGTSCDSVQGCNFTVLKYSSAGSRLWERHLAGPGTRYEVAVALGIAPAGGVAVTGSAEDSTNTDYLTARYSAAGVLLWQHQYDGAAHREDWPSDVVVDASDNVIVTGMSQSATQNANCATLKLGPTGALVWEADYNGSGNEWDGGSHLVLDGAGNIYVSGASTAADSSADMLVLKYTSSGTLSWGQTFSRIPGGRDEASNLLVDTGGNVYVAGLSAGTATDEDIVALKYSSGGTLKREWIYNGSGNALDGASGLYLDPRGNLFLSGGSTGPGSGVDFVALKIDSMMSVVDAPQPASLPFGFRFQSPHRVPSPLDLEIDLPSGATVTVVVYDIQGRERSEPLRTRALEAGRQHVALDVRGLAPGIFLVRVEARAGDRRLGLTRKLILLR